MPTKQEVKSYADVPSTVFPMIGEIAQEAKVDGKDVIVALVEFYRELREMNAVRPAPNAVLGIVGYTRCKTIRLPGLKAQVTVMVPVPDEDVQETETEAVLPPPRAVKRPRRAAPRTKTAGK
jgi:hypothetical protein